MGRTIVNALADLLNEAARALDQPKLQEVLGRRRQALAAMSRELAKPRLRIGVIGVTSSGKSTFLNALMGEQLLPEQSKPTSNVLVHVRKGPERRLIISYLDGRPPTTLTGRAVTAAELLKLTAEDHNPGNRLNVARVELELPSVLIDRHFEIVDTPGLDAYGLDWHQAVTLDEFVPQADVIIYMTSIRNPFKAPDFKALETVVEHDQRVLFVMSGKAMERDDMEGDRVVNSREVKLQGHLARLQRDAAGHRGLKTAGHVLIDSVFALRSRDKDPEAWAWSGFPELLKLLQSFSQDLQGLMAESRLKRAAFHLDESVAQIKLLIARMAGQQGNAEAQALRNAQADKIRKLKAAIADAKRVIGQVECRHTVDAILAPMNERSLGEKSPESAFNQVRDDCDAMLGTVHGTIRTAVAKAKERLTAIVASHGLNAPRDPIPDESMDQLPAVKIATSPKKEEYERKRGWFEGWKFWPGTETRTPTVHVVDVAGFKASMESRARSGLARLTTHVTRVRKTLTDRYVSVLEGELATLEQGLASSERELSALRTEERMLTETLARLERFRQRLSGQEAAAAVQAPAAQPTQVSAPPPKRNPTESAASASRALLPFLASYRELGLHRRFLGTFAQIAPRQAIKAEPYRVAILGLDLQDRTHLVNLLLHRLKSPLVLKPEPDHPTLLDEPNQPFLRHAQLLVAADDTAPGWSDHLAQQITSWADIALVLVDGPRIGSGLNDLHRAPYRTLLQRDPHKVVYVIPHGAKFDHQLPSLAAEVVPDLMANGPYGERPLIAHENYDDRYCDYLHLIAQAQSPAEFRRRWHIERLASLPPFEPEKLEFLYEAGRQQS